MIQTNSILKPILLLLFLSTISTYMSAERVFSHPGLAHKQSDLDRMKAMVDAKIDPWYTSYLNLAKESGAKYTYPVRGNNSITKVVDGGDNYSALISDVRASYLNAIMWIATGDTRHADKAVEIFNAWQNLTHYQSGATKSLDAGRTAWILIEGAEIIKSTYSGWREEDIQKFKDMLVYPGYSNTTVPTSSTTTFYWDVYMGDSGRHGNQDLFGWRVVMAMGVFLDNEIMYDRAYRYFTNQKSREDDLNYEPGPPITGSTPSATNEFFDTYTRSGQRNDEPDYGYNGVLPYFIWENGQCQESSRDQDHASLGLGMLTSMAEIAWNQGDDIYSMLDNRILTGYEWALRYNVSYEYPYADQPEPWEPAGYTTEEGVATLNNNYFIQRKDRSGRWYSKKPNPHYESDFVNISRGNFHAVKRPVYEIAYAHYKVRAGLGDDEVKWTKRALDISNSESGYEKTGWSLDHLGWGGLTCHRTEWMAGDPVSFVSGQKVFAMPQTPCTLNAVDYDYFTGNGQGRTYNDLSNTNTGNKYRPDEAVDIIEADDFYVVTNMEQGEWLSYTVANPLNGIYKISVRHNTGQTGAGFKVVIDNEKELESDLPVTAGYEDTALGNLTIGTGCKVVRVYVTGQSNTTQLSRLSIEYDEDAEKIIELSGKLTTSNTAYLKWEYWNNVPQEVSIYRGTSDNFDDADLLAGNLSDNIYTDETVVGTQNQYVYWIINKEGNNTVISNPLTLSWGYLYDEFADTESIWSIATGAGGVSDGELILSYASSSKMAIISRSGGVTLHAGNYPVLAVKIQLPQDVQIGINNATTSSLGGGTNTYTGQLSNNVYYYDLTEIGFVRSGTTTMVPTDNIFTSTSFSIRLTAPSTDTEPAKLSWIATFRSVEELLEIYPPVSNVKEIHGLDINHFVLDKTLNIRNIPGNTHVNIYTLNGQLITRELFSGDINHTFETAGIYIIRLKNEEFSKSLKVVVK